MKPSATDITSRLCLTAELFPRTNKLYEPMQVVFQPTVKIGRKPIDCYRCCYIRKGESVYVLPHFAYHKSCCKKI